MPNHEVRLSSDFVSGVVTVGVRPSLSVVGITLILRNDLAGGKVIISPCVTNTPTSQEELGNDSNEEKMYTACAVMRAMATKKIEDDTDKLTVSLLTNEQADSGKDDTVYESYFYHLSDTFMLRDRDDAMLHSE